jgi:transcriptional regulator of arginine metabolism
MKKKRQAEILSIIREQEIENQETLQKLLRLRGFSVTQATISRDINELGIEKAVSENGVNCYMQPAKVQGIRFESIFTQAVTNIDYAMNIVCVKCHPGLANAACASFDLMRHDNVVGTISGDDTFFVLMRSELDARELASRLRKMLYV